MVHLRINAWIREQNQWTEKELEKRNEHLRFTAMKIWPEPDSSYSPPEKLREEVSLQEDEDLTGRKLSAYSFKGDEQPCKVWSDMFTVVIQQLYESNQAKFFQFAKNKNNSLYSYFKTTPFPEGISHRQLAANLFLNINNSTNHKQRILQMLFDELNIDQSELIFYLAG